MRCIFYRKCLLCLLLPSTHHISVQIPPFVSLLQAEQHTCEAFPPDDNESWMWTPVRTLRIQLWCFLILLTCAASQFRVCILRRSIWRPIMSREGCPNLKVPPDAAHRCGLIFLVFGRMHRYYPSWPHISRNSLRARKRRLKKRKYKHRVDRHFHRPGWQKLWRKGETSVDVPFMSHLTRSLRKTHLWRPQRPNPSKDADPELRHCNGLVHLETPEDCFSDTCWSMPQAGEPVLTS